jgi:hypothetical protein
MAQQTAVDFLIESIDARNLWTKELREEAQQAKEMEKQQIIKAVDVGFDEGCKFPEDIKLGSGEQYYTQTYGK